MSAAGNPDKQKCRDEKQAGSDQIVSLLSHIFEGGMPERNAVVDDKNAEPNEIEKISVKDSADKAREPSGPCDPCQRSKNQRTVAHGHGAADSVTPRGDKHAEIWREHQL